MSKSLAIKYRPSVFSDVVEQDAIKAILQNQIESGDIRQAYLFCGPSGDGKTTTARIFVNTLNNNQGVPIEMDAASHNSVDDVREISKMATTKSVDAEYKTFIIDECHSLSNQAWQAMLKLIEEPPAKCIFIFCTTDPQKIPPTILSRVQRYQFQRISKDGIKNRLAYICEEEGVRVNEDVIEYIARFADGGMRIAIQYLDKCLALSEELTMDNVTKALGLSHQEDFVTLTDNILLHETKSILELLERFYAEGIDMKQFVKDYLHFILDVNKYLIMRSIDYTQLTQDVVKWIDKWADEDGVLYDLNDLLKMLIDLDSDIKWDSSPLYTIEARFMMA